MRRWITVVLLGCTTAAPPDHRAAPIPVTSPTAVDDTMMFVDIVGTREALRGVTRLRGLELDRGLHDLGGGRWRATGVVRIKSAVTDLEARSVEVIVTMDETEVRRRIASQHEMMKDAVRDAGTHE